MGIEDKRMATSGLKGILASAITRGVTEARARIFGHVLNPTAQRTSHKILRKKLVGQQLSQWYPHDVVGDDPEMASRKEYQ